MNIINAAETAATAALPQVAVAKLGARAILYILAGLAVAALLGWLVWSMFIRPGQQADALKQSQATAAGATSQVETAKAAASTVETFHDTTRIIREITETNHAKIMAAPGAGDALNPAVAAAGRAALCVRPIYAGDPACA